MGKIKIAALCFAMLLIFLAGSACSGEPGDRGKINSGDGEKKEEQAETADKLSGYDYGGAEIRILTSINVSDGFISNSNYMIEGMGEITGEAVDDAVYKRNMDVEALLNVKFKYTQIDEDYATVEKAMSKIIMASLDEYDIFINDIRSVANLSLQGMFQNVKGAFVFDLGENYWYGDFMEDVSIGNEKSFILAGDYFIDILRNCNVLFLNGSMLEDERSMGAMDDLYQLVLDGKWTMDEFLLLTKEFLKDLDGNGKFDKNDQYGFICVGTWGSAIPFMIASDTDVVTKDAAGIPSLTINNPKSFELHGYLAQVYAKDSGTNSQMDLKALLSEFQDRRGLMIGLQRLCTLQDLRNMADEFAILPYPKLNLQQTNYVTSAHDTTEIGAIPTTTPNFEMSCVTLEALCRETKKTVMPVYYEQALKIKYARDEKSAQIIDLIHDNMRNVFPLAYSEKLSGLLGLYDVTSTKDFASGYEKLAPKAEAGLEEAIEAFLGN
ncbi:MAG: hypothetical protein FWG34_07050 [Oscillospiraceae bacterium]|nr:hypothetical protein [Oscillospiraceae bacterium]